MSAAARKAEKAGGKLRKKKLDWLQALDRRLSDDATVWDLTGIIGPAAVLLSKRYRYHGVVPDAEARAQGERRAPNATFVEGTWTTVEMEPGTASAVIAPASPKGASTDVGEFVERAASWLAPGGYLLLNARPQDVAAYAPHSWLDAADDDNPRRAIPTAGALHDAGLEICEFRFSPAKRGGQRTLWLIATPATAPLPKGTGATPALHVDLPLRSEPLTVFIHIPKAAGTTFTEILHNNYPPDSVGRIGNLFKGGGGHDPAVVGQVRDAEKLTLWMHVLTGHLPLGIRDFLPADTRYVTFLREPVDRLLSHYHALIARKRGPNAELPELAPDTPLQNVLADRRLVFDNLQTRMLCGDPEPLGDVTQAMLDRAKGNLRSENLIFGLAERSDESLVLIGHRLGLEKLACRSRRVNSSRPRTTPGEEISTVARQFDHFDVELYAYAQSLFAERAAQEGEELEREVQALREARDALGERGRPARRAAREAKKQRTRGGTAQAT